MSTTAEVIPLSVAPQIIALRSDIESNAQHKGKNFEIVKKAFDEIKVFYGHPPSSTTLCRSGCIREMNKILTNWFKAFDKAGGKVPQMPKKEKGKPDQPTQTEEATTTEPDIFTIDEVLDNSGETLISLETARLSLEKANWGDLLEKANEILGEEVMKSLNKGRIPRKVQVIDKLLEI